MSDFTEEPRLEQQSQSKVEISRNAKGDPQWRIVVVDGATEADVLALKNIALATHKELLGDLL